jgi:hypothetical protein
MNLSKWSLSFVILSLVLSVSVPALAWGGHGRGNDYEHGRGDRRGDSRSEGRRDSHSGRRGDDRSDDRRGRHEYEHEHEHVHHLLFWPWVFFPGPVVVN